MATFADMFNQFGQGLEQGFANPATQLGMQMLAAGGWQPGNPSFGQRFAQAGMGFMDQRAQMAQAQQAQLKNLMEMAKLKAEADARAQQNVTQEQMRQRVQQDPTFMADQPLARSVLLAGGSLQDIKGLPTQSSQEPRQPFQYEETGAGGQRTQFTWDPATRSYKAGQPFTPTDVLNAQTGATNADIARQRLEQEKAERDRQFTLDQNKAAANAAKATAAAAKAEREANAAALKSTLDKKALESGYKGATRQLDETITLIKELEGMKAFDNLFGFRGQVPFTMPGSDTAAAETRFNRLRAGLGLGELVRLEQANVKLTPVSNTDLEQVRQSGGALGQLQDAKAARAELARIRSVLERAKDEAASTYQDYNRLYDAQAPAQGTGAGPSFDQAVQEANQVLQQRPDLRDAINQRLMQKFGRGL